ncbi:MAG: heavy metal translocating P-type ATPase, partial [Actinomycetota bacterium]
MRHTHTDAPAPTHQGHGGLPHHAGHDPAPERPDAHAGHGGHGDHGGNGGHGDHAAMFRRRFWWSLLLTVPVVVTSHMVMEWFGYTLAFPGVAWVPPVLGTAVFLWGGLPFLQGATGEVRARRPGMM